MKSAAVETNENGSQPREPRLPRPALILFYSSTSGSSRRVDGFLAQVLQRRKNHDTFRLHRIEVGQRPDLVERFAVQDVPTLLVVADKRIHGRLDKPRGCRDIAELLSPWLR